MWCKCFVLRLEDASAVSQYKNCALAGLVLEIKTAQSNLRELNEEKAKLDRRLDFLLDGASLAEQSNFKEEYLAKKVSIKDEQARLQVRLDQLESQRLSLEKSEFDMRTAFKSAQRVQDDKKSEQMLKLRVSYRQLFKAIVVGAEKSDGNRKIQFVMREDSTLSAGKTLVGSVDDAYCTSLKLVEIHGVEPRTSSMPWKRSTN